LYSPRGLLNLRTVFNTTVSADIGIEASAGILRDAIWAILEHLFSEMATETLFHRGPLHTLNLLLIPLHAGQAKRLGMLVSGTRRGSALPLPLCVAKTGSNHLNEEFTSILPTGIGERF
jgi:hypothetical protein